VTGFCTQCGGGLLAGDVFCTSCGTPRPQVADIADPVVSAEPPPERSVLQQPLLPVEPRAVSSSSAQTDVFPTPPVEPRHEPAAPIRQRAMSWAIDVAIIAVAFMLTSSIHELLGVVTLVAGSAAYYVVMIQGKWLGTAGHRVVGLAVLDEESREPIGPRTAGLRLAINAVLAIPFGLGLLLNVPMLDRSSGRTVHDVGSGTIVVKTR